MLLNKKKVKLKERKKDIKNKIQVRFSRIKDF